MEDISRKYKKLLKYKHGFRFISENSNELIMILNNTFELEYINENALLKILGYKKEEVLGKKPWGLFHPDDIDRLKKDFNLKKKRINALEEEFRIKYRYKHKKGHHVWIECVNKTFIDTNKDLKIISIARDITEKKKTDQKFKKLEREKSIVLNNILEMITYQDRSLKVIWLNSSSLKHLKSNENDPIGKKCHYLWFHSEEPCPDCPLPQFRQNGRLAFKEIKTNNGKILLMKPFPVYNEEKEFIGAVEITSDITELKTMESRYEKAFEQLTLYKNIFTHDMNNILHNINASVQLSSILYESGNNNKESILDINQGILEQLQLAQKLISNVRKLSELPNKKDKCKKRDLYEMIEKSVYRVRKTFPNKKINIDMDYDGKKLMINASKLLGDAFENILINAIKHNLNSMKHILIKISKFAKNHEEFIKIEFRDNGIGIVDNYKTAIFDGIIKSQNSGGMGVGLSLVKQIIKDHGGEIWVEDKVKGDFSKGSNFVIIIKEVN